MHFRDTFFQYTIQHDIDPSIAETVSDEKVNNKAFKDLKNEIGEAAKWFELINVTDEVAIFKLRVGTAHNYDVNEKEARKEAEEWANRQFKSVDSDIKAEDLAFIKIKPVEKEDLAEPP